MIIGGFQPFTLSDFPGHVAEISELTPELTSELTSELTFKLTGGAKSVTPSIDNVCRPVQRLVRHIQSLCCLV